jgi:hypothetical protein
MADPSAIPCGSSRRKLGDPRINPSDRIDGIRTIRGDLVADEKIFRDRFIHPFFKPMLFFHRPTTIADLPDLVRRLTQRLAGARSGDKKNQKEDEKRHVPILKENQKIVKLPGLRPELPGKVISLHIVPLDLPTCLPAGKAGLRGTLRQTL